MVFVAVLAALFAMVPAAYAAASLLLDHFDATTISSVKWVETDTSGTGVDTTDFRGRLSINGDGTWNNHSVYSQNTYARAGGRAFVARMVGDVATPETVYHFATSRNPASPYLNGYGMRVIGNDKVLGVTVPGVEIPYNVISGASNIKAVNYTLVTILRPSGGSYHLVSGDQFGTYPNARLIWSHTSGTDTNMYVGINGKSGNTNVLSAQVVDLAGDASTQYGLANGADSFSRTSTFNGSTVDVKGSQTWTVTTGAFTTNGSVLSPTNAGSNRAYITGPGDGIHEVQLSSPSSGSFTAGLIFRYTNESNFMYAYAEDWRWVLGKVEGGTNTEIQQTGANLFGYSQTKTIRVIDHDGKICIFSDTTFLFGSTCFSESFNQGVTGVGVRGTNNVTFDNFATYPKTITLPSEIKSYEFIPNKTSTVLANDTFTDTNGTSLTTHTMNSGSGWSAPLGAWTIQSNAAQVTDAPSDLIAVTNVSATDIAVEADVNLSAAPSSGDWLSGVVGRYTDTNNYVYARFLWQSASPEIEVWEIIGGVETLIGATNITGKINPSETHRLLLALEGNRFAAYLNGELITQGQTRILTGTRAGIIVSESALSSLPTFDNFSVYTTAADSAPPSDVMDLQGPGTTSTDPVLTWSEVLDAGGGVNNYLVYRSTSAGSLGSLIGTVSGSTYTYTDTGLSSSGTYYYTVRARDVDNNENTYDDNNQVTVVYNPPTPTPTATPTPTSAPTPTPTPGGGSSSPSSSGGGDSNVCRNEAPRGAPVLTAATAESPTSVRLFFQKAEEPLVDYGLQYGYASGQYVFGANNIGNKYITSIVVSSLAPNTVYYFQLRGNNGCAFSKWSNEIAIKTQKTPSSGNAFSGSEAEEVVAVATPTPPLVSGNTKLATPTSTPAVSAPQGKTPASPEHTQTEVTIFVKDASGKPITGAFIALSGHGEEKATDLQGKAVFSGNIPQNGTVTVRYNGVTKEEPYVLGVMGEEVTMDITLHGTASQNGLIYALVGAIFILLIIIVALLIKRKKLHELQSQPTSPSFSPPLVQHYS